MPPFIFDVPHSEADVLDKLSTIGTERYFELDLNDHTEPIIFTLDRAGWGDVVGVPLLRADGRILPVTDELTRVQAQVGLTVPAGVLLALAAVGVPLATIFSGSTVLILITLLIVVVVIGWVVQTWRALTRHLQAAFLFTPDDLPDESDDPDGGTDDNPDDAHHA
jgi:hypothetical protein